MRVKVLPGADANASQSTIASTRGLLASDIHDRPKLSRVGQRPASEDGETFTRCQVWRAFRRCFGGDAETRG